MKILVKIARIIVGLLFIFSGFVKLDDPIGFSFKLQEYFSPEVLNIPFLIPFALVLAIIIVIFELVLGIMLLIGYQPKFTTWSLLLMIVFFTFLTFYSAYYNKVTDCGCFGDAIPLTPWESFYKDVGLLLLILILFFNRKYINPLFAPASHRWIIFLSFMLCFIFAYYVLMHLPPIDFRPYKVGANLKEAQKLPPDAQPEISEYNWKFNQDGKEVVITNHGKFPQVKGEYVGVETHVVQEGDKPAIHDFVIQKNGNEITEQLLNEEKLMLVVAYNLRISEDEGLKNIKEVSDRALKNGYKVVGLTSSGEELQQKIINKFKLDFEFYNCDETVLKAIVRANPGILTLHKGNITQKKHWSDASEIEFK